MTAYPLRGARVGVFGKGGAGKSTVTVLLANALHEHGYKVVVLDADSSNTGFHRALGIAREPMSLVEHFGGTVFGGGAVTCPVDDPSPLPGAAFELRRLPKGCYGENRDGIGLVVAGKLGGMGPGAGCDGPIAKIARDLGIVSATQDLVTLLDSITNASGYVFYLIRICNRTTTVFLNDKCHFASLYILNSK